MDHQEFILKNYIEPFGSVYYFSEARGFIVWRMGTGGNTELLHIKTVEPRNGFGRELLRNMLQDLLEDPPYATVFGFVLASNNSAQEFYAKMGFYLTKVEGVYAEGHAVIFSRNYRELCHIHGIS